MGLTTNSRLIESKYGFWRCTPEPMLLRSGVYRSSCSGLNTSGNENAWNQPTTTTKQLQTNNKTNHTTTNKPNKLTKLISAIVSIVTSPPCCFWCFLTDNHKCNRGYTILTNTIIKPTKTAKPTITPTTIEIGIGVIVLGGCCSWHGLFLLVFWFCWLVSERSSPVRKME